MTESKWDVPDVERDERSGTLLVKGASGKTYKIGVGQGRDEEGRLDPISHYPEVWQVWDVSQDPPAPQHPLPVPEPLGAPATPSAGKSNRTKQIPR